MTAETPGKAAPCAYCEDDPDHPDPDNAGTCTCASPGCGRGWCPQRDDLAAAMAERDKARADRNSARNAVCNLLDLFGAPDERLMQHASATRATLLRYATDAGVRLDGRAGT